MGGSVTITITATVNAGTQGSTICNQGTASYDSNNDGTNDATVLTDTANRGHLIELFGNPGHSLVQEREFAAVAVDMWLVPKTQERLKAMFLKR